MQQEPQEEDKKKLTVEPPNRGAPTLVLLQMVLVVRTLAIIIITIIITTVGTSVPDPLKMIQVAAVAMLTIVNLRPRPLPMRRRRLSANTNGKNLRLVQVQVVPGLVHPLSGQTTRCQLYHRLLEVIKTITQKEAKAQVAVLVTAVAKDQVVRPLPRPPVGVLQKVMMNESPPINPHPVQSAAMTRSRGSRKIMLDNQDLVLDESPTPTARRPARLGRRLPNHHQRQQVNGPHKNASTAAAMPKRIEHRLAIHHRTTVMIETHHITKTSAPFQVSHPTLAKVLAVMALVLEMEIEMSLSKDTVVETPQQQGKEMAKEKQDPLPKKDARVQAATITNVNVRAHRKKTDLQAAMIIGSDQDHRKRIIRVRSQNDRLLVLVTKISRCGTS